MTLYVDSNEASTSVGKSVMDFFASSKVSVVVKQLVSDYFFESQDGLKICVERTSPSDFWGKLTSGRLFEQLASEISECDELYYVIAGYGELGKMIRFSGEGILSSFEGALTAVSRQVSLVVLWRDYRFPSWLKSVYDKHVAKKDATPPSRKVRKREKHPCESALDVLTAFPGVGVKTAMDILEEHDSLGKALEEMIKNPEVFWAKYVSKKNVSKAVSVIKMEGCRDWVRSRKSK